MLLTLNRLNFAAFGQRRYGTVGACLALLIVLVVLERWRTYSEVVERDVAGYAVIAHEMLHGRDLYSDLWERKPPLLYATFAAAQLVCGYGVGSIFLLNITASIVTLMAIYFAGKGHRNSRASGMLGAGLWVLVGGDLYTQANQPNAEVFVNVFLTAAFALLVHWRDQKRKFASLVLGGLFAAATLYKQHVIITCIALGIGHLLCSSTRAERKSRWMDLFLAGLVVAAVWGAVAGYFWSASRFWFFADTLFRQNVSYAGHIDQNITNGFLLKNLLPSFAPWASGIVGLIAAALMMNLRQLQWRLIVPPRFVLCIAWALGTAFSSALPGKFFPHYYQMWIPVWCIAGGWATAELIKENRPRICWFPRMVWVSTFIWLLGCQALHYVSTADEWSQQKYSLENFVEQRRVGLQLSQMLAPNETFYNFGQDNTLYFYSDRAPASGLLYSSPLEEGNEIARYEQRLVADLSRSKPRLILVPLPPYTALKQPPGVASWLDQHYAKSKRAISPMFELLERKQNLGEPAVASSVE